MAYQQPNEYTEWSEQQSGYSSQPLTNDGLYGQATANSGYHTAPTAPVYNYQQTPTHGQANLAQPRSTVGDQLWNPYQPVGSLGYTQLPGNAVSYGSHITAVMPGVPTLHGQAPRNDFVEPYQQPGVYHTSNVNRMTPYTTPAMVAEGVDRHPFENASNRGPMDPTRVSRSTSDQSTRSSAHAQTEPDYQIHCPYKCGTVLHGLHAVGNLTRHLKSQTCRESPKDKVKYICPYEGCQKEYARSDGLRVHLRRRHGAPPAPPRPEPYGGDEDEEE